MSQKEGILIPLDDVDDGDEIEIIIPKTYNKQQWKRYEQIGEYMWQCPICFEENEDFEFICTMCSFNRGKAHYLGEQNDVKVWDDGTLRYEMKDGKLFRKRVSDRSNEAWLLKKDEIRNNKER